MSGDWDGTPSRRQLLRLGAGAVLGLAAPAIIGSRTASAAPLRHGEILTIPNLRLNPGQYRLAAGLRPTRKTGIRLGLDTTVGRDQGKSIIHNYGHGGAGITLSLACSARVTKAVSDLVGRGALPRVAVIGSGVAGLTVARDLVAKWPRLALRILTKDQSLEDSTSWIAGGQFSPSGIIQGYQNNPQALRDLVQEAFDRIKGFSAATRRAYGIRERFNYSLADVGELRFAARTLGEPNVGNLPFDGLKSHDQGHEYKTWLIEPQIFLHQLLREVQAKGARVRWGHPVTSTADLLQLPESVIINCSGLGSYDLVSDHDLTAVEGQLVLIDNPQGRLKYFVSGGCNGETSYLFCRSADIVIGGSTDDVHIAPHRIPVAHRDAAKAAAIVTRMRHFLAGEISQC